MPSAASSCVRVHLRSLRACGFCRAPRRAGRAGRAGRGRTHRAHRAYRVLTLTVTFTYLLQECIYAYQERNDMDKLARVMFLLLCHVTSLVKQIVFFVDADRIDAMIHIFDEPLYNGGTSESHESHESREAAEARALLGRTARGAGRFLRVYSGTAVVTCTLWAIFPVLRRLHGHRVEFPVWLYFDYQHYFKFAAVLLYSYYVTTLVGIANTTMDAFIATILNQCTTQLMILRMNLESLPARARAAARHDAGEGYERALDRLFLDCLTHYRMICENVGLLQDIFGFAILIQFGIGGWILCMAAYKIVSLNLLSIEFASMALFMCCILTELFLYCYYGNEVTVESGRVVWSVYAMEWVEARASVRRALLVVMQRAQAPLLPAAGRLVPLSLETFLKIIKSSYTFYAVLRQTKET